LHHPSEISFLQLNEFLGRGKNTPYFEIHYAAVCFSLSPVATKEAIVIKEWLTSNEVILENNTFSLQKIRIKQALDDLIHHYFFPWAGRGYLVKKFFA